MAEEIIFEKKDNIGIITLNRENVLNAWNKNMRVKICNIFYEIKKNNDIKAIILTGSGKKAFCSGQDLNEFKNFSGKEVDNWIDEFKNIYSAIRSAEIPVIGAINGVAAGSGFQLALLTDIRVSHKNARFGQVEINSGVVSIVGPWIIKKILGLSKAIELSLTGKLISGEEAFRIGAIHHLTEDKEVMSLSIQIAKELSQKPQNAMKLTKKNICDGFKNEINEVFESAKKYHRISFESGEPQTISKDFLKK